MTKVIFSPQLARKLLKRGFQIIDLKEHNVNKNTVFVFHFNSETEYLAAVEEFKNSSN